MTQLIESHQAIHDDVLLTDLKYEDLFTEEDENDFDTIFDTITDRMSESGDVDYEEALKEANAVYLERTGIDRTIQ